MCDVGPLLLRLSLQRDCLCSASGALDAHWTTRFEAFPSKHRGTHRDTGGRTIAQP